MPRRPSPLELSGLAGLATGFLGLLEAYALRSYVNEPAYPGLARTIASSHGRHGLLDGFWRPLWPAILAIPQMVHSMAPGSAIVVTHVAAAVCFALSCLAFHRLAAELTEPLAGRGDRRYFAISALWTVFAFLNLRWAHPGDTDPDCLAGLFVVLAALAIVRLGRGSRSFRVGGAIGLAVIAAALTSFPLIILFAGAVIGVTVVCCRRHTWRPLAGMGLAVLCVFVPYTVALSVALGHPTVGETARYTEAWEVDGLTREYWWAGQVKGYGTPEHRPRILANAPLTLDLSGDPRNAGAPPFESTWWNAGVTPTLSVEGHLRAARRSVSRYADLVPGPFLTGVALLGLLCVLTALRARPLLLSLRRSALLAGPMLAVPVVLLFVETEQAWVAMPFAIGLTAIVAALPFPQKRRARLCGWLAIAALAVFAVKQPLADLVSDLQGHPLGASQAELVHQLSEGGLRPGDGIAVIDRVDADGWVALGGFRAVGIVVSRGQWTTSDPADQARALALLRAAGARAIVSRGGVGFGPPWVPVPSSDLVLRLLSPGVETTAGGIPRGVRFTNINQSGG